jgi:dTDP-4-amino-4,6-dideoxygalactose transaminase
VDSEEAAMANTGTLVKVPFLDLGAQVRSIRGEIDEAIARVLDSTQFVLGDEVAAFEREFAQAHGAAHGVAVNSGTSALHLALLAAGVGPGDEVITVPNTFVATVAAILYTGATPVYVDVDPVTFDMDPSRLEAAIGRRTKVILPVHLYGQPADMDPISEVARRRGLVVVEDAAQAHLARYQGRSVGSLGDLACFSFYPGKNLGAYGEGGIVLTSSEAHARTIRMLRDWGQDRKYHHVLAGYNYRMEGMQGAILRVKLRHLERWTEQRHAHAARYAELLGGAGVGIPAEAPGRRHVWHVYAVRTPDRDRVMKVLAEQGVQTGIHYPIPVHLQPAYADSRYGKGSFPEAERAAAEVLSLPMYPEMTEDHLQAVNHALRAISSVR